MGEEKTLNIVPFVSSFLIVLALVAQTLSTKHHTIEASYLCFSGFMKAETKARNNLQKRNFYKAPRIHTKTKHNPSTSKEPKKKIHLEYITSRERETLSQPAKLNLYLLFQDNSVEKKLLKHFALQVLLDLYRPIGFDEKFFKEFIKRGKKHIASQQEDLLFKDLFPEDEAFKQIYYKMLKGTRYYDLEKKKGYPPLEDIFVLEPRRKPLIFSATSRYLLKSFFGEDIEAFIHSTEEKAKKEHPRSKNNSIKKEDLIKIIETQSKISLQDVEQFFDFSPIKKFSAKKIIGEDKKTKIRVFKISP